MAFHFDNSSSVFIINTVFVAYLGLLLIVFVPSLSDNTQLSSSILGPNGVNCFTRRDIHERFYDHMDENGLHCPCQLCNPGDILLKNCTCDPNNLERPQISECRHVPTGQFMNSSNFCSRGFECKKCLHPLEVLHDCSNRGPDTVCGCVDGYYMTSPDTCLPRPKCDAEHEPTSGHGDHGTEIRCTRCHVGYFQPNNNSTRKCKKIKQCTVRQGTLRSDAVCLNDPTQEPIQQSTIGYVTTEEPIEPDKPSVTTTQEPTPGYDEITPVGTTTHPTTQNTDGPDRAPCHPQWEILNFFSSNLHGFLWGIFLSHWRTIWKFVRSCTQRGSYSLAENGLEEEKNAVDGIVGQRV
ncbi:uncharacterized protein [Asterias amurensis]|uniref:uncharacterized protein isoform X2 n=1 Tax=Asterias amurensis TaxID=7602 RepID=UPI003AB33C83